MEIYNDNFILFDWKLKYAWSLNLVLKPMKNMSSLQLRDAT